MRKKPKRIPALVKMADKAIKKAVTNALREHKRAGVPIVVWHKNKVVRISAKKIRV